MSAFDDIVEGFRVAVRRDAEVSAALDAEAAKVKAYWQEVAPVDSGDYAGNIRVRKMRDKDGVPIRRVTAMDVAAHIIEYGSEDTEAKNVRARVASRFGYEPE